MKRGDWPKCASFALIGALWGTGCPSTPQEALPPLPELVPDDAPAPRGPERSLAHFSITLAGAVRGEIEPCGCPTLPWGGFERRWVWLESLRGSDEPVFHLDAGQLLVKGLISVGEDARRTRADMLLELSQRVGVEAWTPGPADLLAYSAQEIGVRSDAMGLPAISATWLDAEGQLILPPHVVLERGDVRLGVIGLSAAPSAEELRGVSRTEDPVKAAERSLRILKGETVDLVVALSNLDDPDADRVAAEVPGLAAVLSTKNAAFEPFRTVGDTLIVEVPDRGRHGAVLRLQLGSYAYQPLDARTSDAVEFSARHSLQQRVLREAEGGEQTVTVRDFEKRAEQWREEGRGRNLFEVAHQALGRSFDRASNPISEILASVKSVELKKTEQRLQTARAETRAPQYIGNGSCMGCHGGRFARWAAGPHAHAYRQLVERDEQLNPECLACHTTGFGRIGGWADLSQKHIGQFRGVQCEGCHGPLEGHPDREREEKDVSEVVCLACHDEANSPDFDYESFRKRLACVSGESVPVAGGDQRR